MRDFEKLDISKIQTLIDLAVEEDYGQGDPTSELTISEDMMTTTTLRCREDVVVCGMDVVREVLKKYDERLSLEVLVEDGGCAVEGQAIGTLSGPLRQMLSAERVVLNFLQRLCGVATQTAKYARVVAGTNAGVYDTRKTTPGWRELEKYAVRCGGGCNHRYNLGDAVMLKDNHFAHLGENHEAELKRFVNSAKQRPSVKFVCVEVDDIGQQLETVLRVDGVDIVLLDNMSIEEYRQAVKMRNERCGQKPLLEASGGITLKRLRDIAETGVERISVGALTHSVVAVDIGLDK